MNNMLRARAEIQERDSGYLVNIIWSGAPLDRPHTYGIEFRTRRLADRYVAAVDAQKVFVNPKIAKDVYGKSYVVAECRVYGRHANKDLLSLGF